MVTMATNPFCESMKQRVTCMGALHPHKYTKCIPHRRNKPSPKENIYTRPQKGEKGDIEYIFCNSQRTTAPKF